MSDKATLDSEAIATLRDLDRGDPGFFRGVLGDYRAQAAALPARLREAHARGDGPALKRLAHAFKGASGSVGAEGMVALAAEIERASLEAMRGLPAAAALIAELESTIPRLVANIDSELGRRAE